MAANGSPAFFVYGTLKRGECREAAWPAPPLRIETGYVRGALYDLGPYPALTAGTDWVRGETWWFDPADASAVRATLDKIEVYDQPGEPDLYLRRTIDVVASPGGPLSVVAETYVYADIRSLWPQQRMMPEGRASTGAAYAEWTARGRDCS